MKVQMVAQVTGTRDGETWPAPGGFVDVPADEAASLIAAGIARAVEVKKAPAPEAALAPAPETAQHPTKPTRTRKA